MTDLVRHTGAALTAMPQKFCTKCGDLKFIDAFPKNKNMNDGHHYWCKVCGRESSRKWREANPTARGEWGRKNKERINARRKIARAQPGYVHAESLKRLYGITRDHYLGMAEAQDNLCAICQQPSEKVFHVDHDHETGKIRGLLCGNCNKALGLFRDDPNRMIRAAEYLRRSNQ